MTAEATAGGGFRRVAVVIDDWPTHDAAIGMALTIVAADGELIFVQAVNRVALTENCTTPHEIAVVLDAVDVEESRLLSSAVAWAAARGVRSTTRVLDADGFASLEDFVREAPFDAVSVGTHADGRTSARRLGPTAKAFLRSSPAPVFINCEEDAARAEAVLRNVLVVLDGSIPQQPIAESAIALARRSGARLVFAHVDDGVSPHSLDRDALASARNAAVRAGLATCIVSLYGYTSAAINAAAQVAGADAIVLGEIERGATRSPQPAAVVNMVIRTAQVPVCVVPVQGAAALRRKHVA